MGHVNGLAWFSSLMHKEALCHLVIDKKFTIAAAIAELDNLDEWQANTMLSHGLLKKDVIDFNDYQLQAFSNLKLINSAITFSK